MVREVLVYPDPTLFEVSAHIRGTGGGVDDLADDLVETMTEHGAAGISAVQVGEPLRMIAVASGAEPLVMLNPTWSPSTASKRSLMDEGCLSFPGVVERVERFEEVEVTYDSLEGVTTVRSLVGVPAQAVQHECEHLDGKLFIQNLPLHRRDRVRAKMKKLARSAKRVGR